MVTGNGFNRFPAGWEAKPLKRLGGGEAGNTGLKPGVNEMLQETEMRSASVAPQKFRLPEYRQRRQSRLMFSHVVIFWTDPAQPNAADELLAGANQYLKPIPGVLQFHIGKMVGSHRPVVDQTYQVALNLVFPTQQAQDEYQVHPLHVEFVEKVFKRVCKKVLVYDFA